MHWYSQLTQLILSFYREDLPQLQRLDFLHSCRVSRRWGVLRIDCNNREMARQAIGASELLKAPVAQMRLAQEMKIMVKGELVKSLPIDSSTTLMNELP